MRIPYFPTAHWTVVPNGNIVVVDGARYVIDEYRGDGSVMRISRTVNPVALSYEEREVEQARIAARFPRLNPAWVWDGQGMPATKPPVSWLHAAQDGAIWVRVAQPGAAMAESERDPSAPSHVQEPTMFDVFEADGRYRGQVLAPDGMELAPYPVIGADKVWAVAKGADGVPFVARFRMVVE